MPKIALSWLAEGVAPAAANFGKADGGVERFLRDPAEYFEEVFVGEGVHID